MHDPARKSPMAAMLEYIHAQGADVVAENLTSVQDRLHAVFRDLDARMEQVPMDATVLPVAYALMCRFSDHTMAIVEKLEREAPTATTWLEALAILRRLFDEFSSMRPMLLRFAELADFCPRLEAQPDEQGAAVHKVSVLDRDAGWCLIACAHDPSNAIAIAADRLRGQTPGCVVHLSLDGDCGPRPD